METLEAKFLDVGPRPVISLSAKRSWLVQRNLAKYQQENSGNSALPSKRS